MKSKKLHKKEIFQKELLIDFALDLNNISRDNQKGLSVQEKNLIGRIEVNVNRIFEKLESEKCA